MTQSWFGSRRKCILAVDDAAFILSRITDALGKYYNMVTVNSGSRALKYLDKNKPDLILLDIRMPIRDGFDILREIRSMEDRADIPIIMLTAMEDKQSVMKGIEMGVCDYVLKPFAPDDLLERVQRILNPKRKNWISSGESDGGSRQEGAQESSQESAQKSGQEGRQEGAQESGQEGRQEGAQESGQEGRQEDAQESGQEGRQEDAQESGQEGCQEDAQESAAESSYGSQGGDV